MILLLAACVFLLLALFSYTPQDPGWSSSGPEQQVANWMGAIGAWLSDVLYSLFGASALWWPGMLGYAAWRLMRRDEVHLQWDPTALAVRSSGLMLVLLATTTLGALHFYNDTSDLPYSVGGILGEGLSDALMPLVSMHGTTLLALAAFLCGFPLFTGVSWMAVMDELGSYIYRVLRWIASQFGGGSSASRHETQAVVEASADKSADAEPSVEEEVAEEGEEKVSWWRRLLGRGKKSETKQWAEPALPEGHRLEPQFQESADTFSVSEPGMPIRAERDDTRDNGTDIPWEVPEHTPSAKRPEAAYSAQESRLQAAFTANQPETSANEPMIPASVARPIAAGHEEEAPDNNEPRLTWGGLDDKSGESQASAASSEALVSAEQAYEENRTPEEPALWTVEHLQNQRPVLDDLPEPDGELPSLRLLTPPSPAQPNYTPQQLADMAELLVTRLHEYGVKAEVVETWPGPVITRFEIKPAAGVKVSKISNLAKDLARSLMVKSVRVVEVIPGRPTVGIEIPNPNRAMIRLREVIDSDAYQQAYSPLTLALGHDIGGGPVVANLGKMPHLLVAGTTGSGKSVGVNGMLISMLLKATPDELRLIMVDPKMLELSVYDGIPHLLAPVVTDMKEAANSLRWCVAEMERRYKLMAAMGVRNIAGFNAKLDEASQAGAQVADPLWEPQPWQMHEPPPVLEKLPYIVVVIDEFADMFMIVGKKVEELIARLAQKARAAGIHLILATQRPSVDVVTGLIKANVPTRMAFQVSSKVDSRTILDQGGAEALLGHGDMLYLPAGAGMPTRVHGAFVDDDEVHRVVEDWKRRGEPEYIEEILTGGVNADALTGLEAENGDGDDAEQDALYDEAVMFVTESRRASISAVQRRFKIGYNRAARLVESMEAAGVVTSMGSNGSREVLAPPPVGN